MKSVKNFLFAVLLVCALAFNTFAGDVETPGAPKPLIYGGDPLIIDTKTTSTTTQETEVTSDTSDYLFYEALAALLSVY